MMKLLVLPLVFLGVSAFAANRGEGPKPVDCQTQASLLAEIETLKSMSSEHHSAVNSFLDDITARLESWHKKWAAYEGKPGAVPTNTFAPLKKTIDEVGEIQNSVIWKNLGSVEERFDALLSCLEQKKSK